MPTPVRQTLFASVVSVIQGITTVGGYNTNIGQHVSEWRDLTSAPFGPNEAATDVCSVKDTNEVADQEITLWHQKLLDIEIDFATNIGATPKEVAEHLRAIIADFEKAIGTNRKWGGYALDTDYHYESSIGVRQEGPVAGGGTFKFKIKYRNKSFDPYTQ